MTDKHAPKNASEAAEAALEELNPDTSTWPTGEQIDAIIETIDTNAKKLRPVRFISRKLGLCEEALQRLDEDTANWPTAEEIEAIILAVEPLMTTAPRVKNVSPVQMVHLPHTGNRTVELAAAALVNYPEVTAVDIVDTIRSENGDPVQAAFLRASGRRIQLAQTCDAEFMIEIEKIEPMISVRDSTVLVTVETTRREGETSNNAEQRLAIELHKAITHDHWEG